MKDIIWFVPPLLCFSAAIYLLATGVTTGWGWLLLIGCLTSPVNRGVK